MWRVPPYIDSTNLALFGFPSNSEKLSKELIAFSDAESARGQMKEPPVRASILAQERKTQKAAVRPTLFQISTEAHDTYTVLPCVFFLVNVPDTKCN